MRFGSGDGHQYSNRHNLHHTVFHFHPRITFPGRRLAPRRAVNSIDTRRDSEGERAAEKIATCLRTNPRVCIPHDTLANRGSYSRRRTADADDAATIDRKRMKIRPASVTGKVDRRINYNVRSAGRWRRTVDGGRRQQVRIGRRAARFSSGRAISTHTSGSRSVTRAGRPAVTAVVNTV